MLVRRWIAIVGIVIAVAAATAATVPGGAEPELESRAGPSEAEVVAASMALESKIDEFESKLQSAVEPQRSVIATQLRMFTERLEQFRLDQSLKQGEVAGVAPPEPGDNGQRTAWIVAALGAIVAIGAAASARRTDRRILTGDGDVGKKN